MLDAAGLKPPPMDGRSALPLARGERIAVARHAAVRVLLGAQLPADADDARAARRSRYKYIRYYGLWDTDELYDLQDDPLETRNLIRDPSHRDIVTKLNARAVQDAGARPAACTSRSRPTRGNPQNLRRRDGSRPADFPPGYLCARGK